MKLTAIIPTRNEQQYLPNCLKSVAFADEILVIDSGSTDNTVDIAKKHGATVIHHPWQGFAAVHNYAATKAKHEWLLYIDADERVNLKLKHQIQSVLQQPTHSAYQVSRLNYIMGKPLKHGGWYPDPVTRLIQKTALDQWVGELHEYPRINGSIGTLNAHIIHLSHRGLTWMLHKTLQYTQLTAKILHQNHHPPVKVKNFFGAMAREFYFRAIKKSGWRDGFIGWLEIIYQTFNAFLIQVFLWELQQSQPMDQKYHQLDRELSREL